jgi:DNA-binding transcriptional regulator PaaX
VGQQRARSALIRWLRANGFGYLQDSVWITPDAVDGVAKTLQPFRDDAASFTVLLSRCAPGFTNASLVTGAWPWAMIHDRYQRYLDFAATAKKALQGSPMHPRELFAWIRRERGIWSEAFDLDPFLPRELWPKDYLGERARDGRVRLLGLLKRHAGQA